jgi:hypothetical protein
MKSSAPTVAAFVATILLLAVGCGNSPTPPAPPDPPTPPPVVTGQIKIIAPADGSAVNQTKVKLSVSFTGGADPSTMRALLDGVDITNLFGAPDSSGVRSVMVSTPAINLGKNQIQITSGVFSANTSFFLALPDSVSSPTAPPSLLVPIQTRVVKNDGSKPTDYNIAVYPDPNNPTTPTLYQATAPPSGANQGFQILYLSRVDLSLISNITVDNFPPPQDGEFQFFPFYANASSPPSACPTVGCLEIIQSIGTIGYAPCISNSEATNTKDCASFAAMLNNLGLSGRLAYANGANPNIAFSSISNVPSSSGLAGTFFESLTCSGSDYSTSLPLCDNLGYPNTSFTALSNAPPSQLGNISGALIRDNFNNYTFAQNAPAARFASLTTNNGHSHNFTVNGVDYPSSSLNGADGGFHVLILNAKDLSLEQNVTFPSSMSGDATELNPMVSLINGYKSYGNLVFVAAFGLTTYNGSSRGTWYNASLLAPQLGGTQQVFYLLNNPALNPVVADDYSLVGSFQDGTFTNVSRPQLTGLESQYNPEMSSVISRVTERYPLNSDMEGILRVNNQGFYAATSYGHNIGLSTESNAQILSASLLAPVPWPFPGPSSGGSQAAYNWISLQLCCSDIRSSYVNLNVSPTIWLSQISKLTYDSSKISNSSQADFDAMVQQLSTEFQYVALVRNFQNNVVSLYQDQQANISLLLQEDSDKVLQNLNISLSTPSKPASWIDMLNSVLTVESSLLGIIPGGGGVGPVTNAVRAAISLGTVIASDSASHTNTPAGSPLRAIENEEITAAQLAATAANEFSATLISVGGEFDRVVTDWGRLKALGAPLNAGQVSWDGNSSGRLLSAFDRLYQRELYIKLLQANNVVQYMPYTGDTHNVIQNADNGAGTDCDLRTYFRKYPSLLWYPNGLPNTDTKDPNNQPPPNFPYEYQWGTYAPVNTNDQNEGCAGNGPGYTNTFGLFNPLDPGNADSLGAYPFWIYTRKNWATVYNERLTPCYEASC